MSDELDPVKEPAKAAQEVAKTGGKAIDAGREFGGFIAKFIAGPLEQGMGIFQDKLTYMRWERQVRLMQQAEKYMQSIGMDTPTRPIPLKFALPLIQAASLEDDDDLQDRYAKLLVNAGDEQSVLELRRAYIDILENLTPLEGKILDKIYGLSFEEAGKEGVLTADLPQKAILAKKGLNTERNEPTDEVKLAISNLVRLNCLRFQSTWAGAELLGNVNPTFLGKSFIEACTLRTQ